jgi:hypothetical protein
VNCPTHCGHFSRTETTRQTASGLGWVWWDRLRPHDGLRDPEHPGRAFTPNEKYAAMVEAAGYVPVALTADDYIELLPARWHAVNAYGIKVNRRTYDSDKRT